MTYDELSPEHLKDIKEIEKEIVEFGPIKDRTHSFRKVGDDWQISVSGPAGTIKHTFGKNVYEDCTGRVRATGWVVRVVGGDGSGSGNLDC